MVQLNQILVPKSGVSTVKKVLDQSKKSGQFLVDVLKFCSEYPAEHKKETRLITALQQSVWNTDLSGGLNIKVSYR